MDVWKHVAVIAVLTPLMLGESPNRLIFDGLGISAFHALNITGRHSVVGITDTGIYLRHDEFSAHQTPDAINRFVLTEKVVHYETAGDDHDQSSRRDRTCGHGTHVSGILAGRTIGVAPDAKIAFLDIAYDCLNCSNPVALRVPTSTTALFLNQTKAGAKVISFSWGRDARGNDIVDRAQEDYNFLAKQIDAYLYEHPDVLVVTAAGNNGDDGAKSLFSPAGAKNVLTIGATYSVPTASDACPEVANLDSVASFSSRGPTHDGRLKPDLVLPGVLLQSAQSMPLNGTNESTSLLCVATGTSQATPVASGMAVLVRDWLEVGAWATGLPSPTSAVAFVPSSLVKAMLIHAAVPTKRRLPFEFDNTTVCSTLVDDQRWGFKTVPDPIQGYGRPNMTNLLNSTAFFLPNHTGVMPSLTTGFEHTYDVMVVKPQRLRITVVWTDAPVQVGATRPLTNDLDLTLTLASGDVIAYPLSGQGKPDSVNNVEVIDVSFDELEKLVPRSSTSSQQGKLHVVAKVIGTSVVQGPQLYSIVSTVRLQSRQRSSTDSTANDTSLTSNQSSAPTNTWIVWAAAGAAIFVIAAAFVALLVLRRKRLPDGQLQSMHASLRSLFRCREACTECGFFCTDSAALMEHVYEAHPQPQTCRHCHFTTATPELLQSHVDAFH
ncbi:hypothetical protein H310_14770 [Aphanomyces invadans]|uniref:subtilisin n=1 Tax=Aphanomyces invadans TaxID=157072 RepID=A0A024TAW1_9STRA|nr:hypothetical protein H310_14770 [Aphanomyces invadans]ETV90447.1 hypothetical protein H310_14770 [Aphanomyces invadans]|eukprot:XP_008880921.1 hypothetical protein H310_14770 [Aphanomyces invadans]